MLRYPHDSDPSVWLATASGPLSIVCAASLRSIQAWKSPAPAIALPWRRTVHDLCCRLGLEKDPDRVISIERISLAM